VIEAIQTYDLCIADLTGHNPNVFYELALAQAARRPVVMLKLAGEAIPFDVNGYRVMEYDLKPRSIKTDKWLPDLKDQVNCVLAPDYEPPQLLQQSGPAAATTSVLPDTAAAPAPAEESARADLDGCLAIMRYPLSAILQPVRVGLTR
jgi:hypothetical protein